VQADTTGRGGFLFNVNVVFLSQIVIYGLAFGLRVVLARGLGDSDLGTYSLFYVAVLVAGGIGNLGVGLGNIYFLNKGTYSYGVLLAGSMFVLISTCLTAVLFVVAWGLGYGPDLFVSGRAFWLYAAALPAVVAYVLLTSFLHGSSRFVALAAVAVTQGVVGFAGVGALYAADKLDVFWAIVAWTGSFWTANLLALALVRLPQMDVGALFSPRWDVLKEQIKYGSQGQIANLAQLFNYRLDQFLVAAYTTRADVGHYSVAVGLGESVWWISSAVALVLLPRLTAMKSEHAAEATPLICRNTLLVSTLGAIVLVAVSAVAIRIVFGSEYDPAYLPMVLLMPGVVAASATRVLGSYLFSQGRIIYNTYATFIALGLTLALDFGLIPWLEVPGAAIASSVAYIASLIATLYWYRKVSGGPIWEALIPQPGDVHLYGELLQRIRSRGRRAENGAT
jgi:O-antigen/teichoic acid export membrane protein